MKGPSGDDAAPLAGGAGVNESHSEQSLADRERENPILAGWQHPRPLAKPDVRPDFPVDDGWPPGTDGVREYLIALAEEKQVPIDMPGLLVLPMLVVAIAQAVEVEGSPGWREPIAIWALVLARSGERKSQTIAALARPIVEWEQDQAEQLAPGIAEAGVRRRIDQRRVEEITRLAGRGETDVEIEREAMELARKLAVTDPVTPPQLLTEEPTTEALAQVLRAGGERALVASAEADALDAAGGRYSNGPNWGVWLKGHAGDPIRIHRKTSDPVILNRPALSVALAVQPDSVADLFGNRQAHGRGVIARFITSWPESLMGRRRTNPQPVSDSLRSAYELTLRHLLDIDRTGQGCPAILRLTADAQHLLDEFRKGVEHELREAGEFGDRSGWGSKLPGAIIRIAAVLHCVKAVRLGPIKLQDIDAEIDFDTIRAAIAWADYLAKMDRIVAGAAGLDRDAVIAERVLAWTHRTAKTRFRRADAYHSNRCQWVQAPADLDGALALLEDHGYIRREPQPHPSTGRPPSPTYLVNPRWIIEGKS